MKTDQTAEACWWLHNTKGLSITEIARRMNMTPSGVHIALGRVRPEKTGQALNVSNNRVIMDFRVASRAEDREAALSRVVDRDPCLRCGVRRDKHDQGGCRRYVA